MLRALRRCYNLRLPRTPHPPPHCLPTAHHSPPNGGNSAVSTSPTATHSPPSGAPSTAAASLLLTDEHYATHKPLSYHAQHLPKDVRWYADPSGAPEIAEKRCAGFADGTSACPGRQWSAPVCCTS